MDRYAARERIMQMLMLGPLAVSSPRELALLLGSSSSTSAKRGLNGLVFAGEVIRKRYIPEGNFDATHSNFAGVYMLRRSS